MTTSLAGLFGGRRRDSHQSTMPRAATATTQGIKLVFANSIDTQRLAMYMSDSWGQVARIVRRLTGLRVLEQRADLWQLRAGHPLSRFGHPGAARQAELRRCADFWGDHEVCERACGERMAPS